MNKSLPKNDHLWNDWVMKPRRIVLYARVSTKGKGQDTRNQLAQLRDFCAKQDWKITHEYIDQASGKNGDRPQFKAMMEAAARGHFDLVLFWSLDRFSRAKRVSFALLCPAIPRYDSAFVNSQIAFAGHKNNAFVELGGAAWKTRKEQLEQWRLIPGVCDTGMTTCFLLPKRNVFRSLFTRPNLNFSTWVTPSDQCPIRNCREEPSRF